MIIEATIPIDPGRLAINKAKRAGKRGGKPYTYKTPDYVAAVDELALRIRLARAGRAFVAGPVSVTIAIAWPRKRRKGPAIDLPMGDLDAPIKGIFDAMTQGGIWSDDAQATSLAMISMVDAKSPRISIRVTDACVDNAQGSG